MTTRIINHQDLADELLSISSPEERLEWLIERQPIVPTITLPNRQTATKMEGCISGLWLRSTQHEELLNFACSSDSTLVQGVVSFLCDFFSMRSANNVINLGKKPITDLMLDTLLTTTRKRAVWTSCEFITSEAERLLIQRSSANLT